MQLSDEINTRPVRTPFQLFKRTGQVSHFELPVDVFKVCADGADADIKEVRNLLILYSSQRSQIHTSSLPAGTLAG